jgi:hypothetical protein
VSIKISIFLFQCAGLTAKLTLLVCIDAVAHRDNTSRASRHLARRRDGNLCSIKIRNKRPTIATVTTSKYFFLMLKIKFQLLTSRTVHLSLTELEIFSISLNINDYEYI